MQSTPLQPYLGETNGDLIDYIAQCRAALGACNADKAAIEAETTPGP